MTALNMSMMVVGLVITTVCLFTAKGEEEKVSSTLRLYYQTAPPCFSFSCSILNRIFRD